MTRVVVVGLGPAGADLLTTRARQAVSAVPHRFVRTRRHPAVVDLAAEGIHFASFDEIYETAHDLDTVYDRIVTELLDAVRAHGTLLYAVPGNPALAERSVHRLRERAGAAGVDVEMIPGIGFTELAWPRVGVDPLGGARVLDGRALDAVALEVGGPVLVAQVDDPLVLSDVKLALLERLPPTAPVTVLQRLGLPDEQVSTLPLAELDRAVTPDHLTSLFVDLPQGTADTYGALVALGRRLRGPGGCPWDAEQTHRSLTRYLLEEAYEVVDAIEAIPADDDPADRDTAAAYAALADELGDLLFQVVFHAVLAEEARAFTVAEVALGIHDKLVRRHPHVFGEVEVASAGEVVRNWEQIKKDERGSDSLVDSVPVGLPALLYTHKLFRKAASIGLEPGDRAEALDALERAIGALRAGPDETRAEALVADVLAAGVALARDAGVDAESALRGWAGRYRMRFQRMERLARVRGLDLHTLDPGAVGALWAEAGESGA